MQISNRFEVVAEKATDGNYRKGVDPYMNNGVPIEAFEDSRTAPSGVEVIDRFVEEGKSDGPEAEGDEEEPHQIRLMTRKEGALRHLLAHYKKGFERIGVVYPLQSWFAPLIRTAGMYIINKAWKNEDLRKLVKDRVNDAAKAFKESKGNFQQKTKAAFKKAFRISKKDRRKIAKSGLKGAGKLINKGMKHLSDKFSPLNVFKNRIATAMKKDLVGPGIALVVADINKNARFISSLPRAEIDWIENFMASQEPSEESPELAVT